MLAGSIALVCASVAGFVSLYSSAGDTATAVVVVRPVAQGQLLSGADLGEARVVVAGGVSYIPLSQVGEVSGRRAASTLLPGTLLTVGDLSQGHSVALGDAVVGVALKDGSYPASGSGVAAGDTVEVVQTAAPGTSVAVPVVGGSTSTSTSTATVAGGGVSVTGTTGADLGVLAPRAVVVAVGAPSSTSSSGVSLLVSLEVPAAQAAQLVAAAAAGQVGLVLLPAGTGAPVQVPTGAASTGTAS